MKRYILQEMKISAFMHYEIIDTFNKCITVYNSKSYSDTIKKLDELNAN